MSRTFQVIVVASVFSHLGSSTGSMSNECATFCTRMMGGECVVQTFCDSELNCNGLQWTDESKQEITTVIPLSSATALRVTCGEAADRLLRGDTHESVRKRLRGDGPESPVTARSVSPLRLFSDAHAQLFGALTGADGLIGISMSFPDIAEVGMVRLTIATRAIDALEPLLGDKALIAKLATGKALRDLWGDALQPMIAVCLNSPLMDPRLVKFAHDNLAQYLRLVSLVGGDPEDNLDSLRLIRAAILNGPPDNTAPRGSSPAAQGPFEWIERARRVGDAVRGDLAFGLIPAWAGGGDEMFDIIEAVLQMDSEQRMTFSSEIGSEFADSTLAALQRMQHSGFELVREQRSDLIRFLAIVDRSSSHALSLTNRRDMIPRFLWSPNFGGPRSELLLHLESQQRSPAMLSETIDKLARLSRKDMLSVSMPIVTLEGSDSVGMGVVNEWVSTVIAHAINPANGLFESTDTGSAVTPVKGTEDALRQNGRVIAIGLRRGVTPGIHLTSGCLYWLSDRRQRLDRKTLTVWADEASSGYTSNLLKLKDEDGVALAASVGVLSFPGSDSRELSADNVDAFIQASIADRAYGAVEEGMKAILRGIHDVLPFGQLSWLSMDEVRELLGGPRSIDPEALLRTTRFTNGIPGSSGQELGWLSQIVTEMNQTELSQFVEFFSGSPFPPTGGFQAAAGTGTWLAVTTDSSITMDGLPKSRLCHILLRVPKYTSKAVMKERLLTAIAFPAGLEAL